MSEIADLCFEHYGPIRSDGSNVTLSNGHRYIVQEEWSRRAGRCALQFTAPVGYFCPRTA